jgi:dienelactone hydrolase
MGMFIELRAEDGFLSRGYLALPPAGSGPGIIVQQEIFGLNRQIRGICDLLAEEGYVVLAPDLLRGSSAMSSWATPHPNSRRRWPCTPASTTNTGWRTSAPRSLRCARCPKP